MLLVEVALIKFYGRKDHLMGPLLNATDGGEGVQPIGGSTCKTESLSVQKEWWRKNF